MDADRICFYSLTSQELSAAWPAGWNPADAVAVVLSIGKRDPVAFKVLDGRVIRECGGAAAGHSLSQP